MASNPVTSKPGRIGLCCYSLVRRIRAEQPWLRFQQLDLPREAKEVFGLDTVEFWSEGLETHHPRYLDRIRAQAEELGVCLHGMAVDVFYGDLCAADEAERKVAVARNLAFVPVAERLGLAYFRVNTGGRNPTERDDVEQAVRSLRKLTDVAWDRGIRVAIENHGGLSLDPAAVAEVIETVGRDRMATLPDIGNFGSGEDAYDKVARMMPYAVAVHAKLLNFREDGEAGNIDLKRMVKVAQTAGFRGTWSIESVAPDAGRTDETILKSKELLEKHLG